MLWPALLKRWLLSWTGTTWDFWRCRWTIKHLQPLERAIEEHRGPPSQEILFHRTEFIPMDTSNFSQHWQCTGFVLFLLVCSPGNPSRLPAPWRRRTEAGSGSLLSLGPSIGQGTQDAFRKYLLIKWMTGGWWPLKVTGQLTAKGYSCCTMSSCRTRIKCLRADIIKCSYLKPCNAYWMGRRKKIEGLMEKLMIQRWGLEERKWKAEGGCVDRKSLWGPRVAPLPGTSFSSDLETADQRSPPDSNAHRLEGGRPSVCYAFSPKRKCSGSTGHVKGNFWLKAMCRLME